MTEQIEAGTQFLGEFGKTAEILAAFWLKADEESFWYLHIAADEFLGPNLNVDYGQVLRITAEMRNPYLDPFRVKLIPSSNRPAKAAIEFSQRYSGKLATRLHEANFGGVGFE